MPWQSIENNSLRKAAHAKNAEKINKWWGQDKEKQRRERVSNALELEKDKSKINKQPVTYSNTSAKKIKKHYKI